jgi:hypothetical protein
MKLKWINLKKNQLELTFKTDNSGHESGANLIEDKP